VTYPARFQLVAAMNPCRCGHANDPGFACKRAPNARCGADYQSRVSGPLLDRIDLHIEVPAVSAADLVLPAPAEGSREVAARVAAARMIAAARFAALGRNDLRSNAEADATLVERFAAPDNAGMTLLRDAADAMRLSARGYHRVLKVARTIADLVLPAPAEGSREVAARVAAARMIATARFAALGRNDLRSNAEADATLIERLAAPDSAGMTLLRDASEAMRLSARGYHRVLKVARTIADLDGAETVGRPHIAEALAYRAAHDRIALAA